MYVNVWRPLLASLGLCAMLACGGGNRFVVLGTAKAPSTSGIIELDDMDGGNTLVTVHMEHLHPPSRLDESFESYVVWFQSEGGSPVRAGELRYDPDKRTGDLSETATFTEFVVKITAEKTNNSSEPSKFVIATQEVRLD